MSRGFKVPERTQEVPVIGAVAAVGIGVASLSAGLAVATVVGTGMLAMSASMVGKSRERDGIGKSGKRKKKPMKRDDVDWDEEGRILNWERVLKLVEQGGVSPEDRAMLWPFLLGVFLPTSTFAERAAELQRLRNVYAKLVFVCEEIDMEIEALKSRGMKPRSTTPTAEELTSYPSSTESSPEKTSLLSPRLSGGYASFAESHRIIVMDAVRTDMKGISEMLLKNADQSPGSWEADQENIERKYGAPTVTVLPVSVCEGLPELMLVDPPQPKPSQAVASGEDPIWRSAIASQMINGARHLTSSTRTLMMRLVNILSAYAVHDPESGYCQGMSDIAAIFVCLEEEDALAFACFERLMRTVRQNFRHDETGIKHQLSKISEILADTDPQLYRRLETLGAADCMFAYRMVVVMLRRELPLEEALILWEIKWALDSRRNRQTGEGAGSENGNAPNSRTISLSNSKKVNVLELPSSNVHSTVESISKLLEGADVDDERSIPKGANKHLLKSQSSTWRGQKLKSRASPPDFILQFVAAVIKMHRHQILKECSEPDDILRLFNGIYINFWQTLSQAKKQYKAYCQGITVMQSLYS